MALVGSRICTRKPALVLVYTYHAVLVEALHSQGGDWVGVRSRHGIQNCAWDRWRPRGRSDDVAAADSAGSWSSSKSNSASLGMPNCRAQGGTCEKDSYAP